MAACAEVQGVMILSSALARFAAVTSDPQAETWLEGPTELTPVAYVMTS